VPEDLAGYRELRQALRIPIAGGENEHSLFGFRDFLGARCVDIAQPDIGSAGGFTACRHIVALAHAHGVQVNPHVWGSAIAQAASVQLIAAVPVAHHSVFAQEPILEYDRSSHPFREQLVAEPLQQQNGSVTVPSRPGLGVQVDRTVLDRYRPDHPCLGSYNRGVLDGLVWGGGSHGRDSKFTGRRRWLLNA
jgi:D-galactarolactone cycloisomerase